jgi:arginyl-tRNA synthetase
LYRYLEHRLAQRVLECLARRHPGVALPRVVIEQPPRVELGDFAIPMFPFAKPLRSAPLKIAEAIRADVGEIQGVAGMTVTPPGYLNVKMDRAWMATGLAEDRKEPGEIPAGKILVEHSSINPNKAAHIGHLRNAVLGDTFVRLLRYAGREVDVQNYIDNTGVQVADVVVGFTHLDKKSPTQLEALTRQPRFDYYCWDLYARVSRWYEANPQNKQARPQTLHAIEDAASETAAMAEVISTAVLRRHLETMDRLDIEYDFLPRESEILHLHFWDAAFTKLKETGVLTFENEGKNKGCWVMRRAGTEKAEAEQADQSPDDTEDSDQLSEEDQKVIVRSNGTVGYVGKDIAYHMWKFGLLGRDFGYRKFYRYPNNHDCWISTTSDDPEAGKNHPHFGSVAENYNVVDARQSEAQNTVKEALRDLGHGEAADHFTHFSYGMVVLTPRCAAELGYNLSEEEKARPFISVSGRKGFGVKADDLLDRLIASAKKEVDSRHPQLSEPERLGIATQISIGALRYFMLKYTKQSVIAFDFKDALSFEGETGPYAQYAVVRASSIFRKAGLDADEFPLNLAESELAASFSGQDADEIWELWLASSKTSSVVEQCIATTEPAYLAKHVFQLAQLFNTFYHRHPILIQADEKRKQFLLATVAVVRRELIRALAVMGITVPPVM